MFNFTKAIKKAMIDAGKDQRVVSAEAKIEYSRLSQIINGIRPATEPEMLRISGVLQRPVSELFGIEIKAEAS